ncbi:MAG TPA: hypothetical protein VGW34_15120 [Allosphingosinicella sp.]|nr:hypothetical protein [Allosphingosinicella sp.]
MPRTVKFLIGLAATVLMGWIYHAPLGNGEAFVGRLEAEARSAVAATGLPGIEVRLGRDPLSRAATLSGPADDFQREGMGEFPGLNDRIRGIEGISGVGWADQGGAKPGLPLLVETLIGVVLAFLIGAALGWLLFGRPKKQSYL